MEKDYILRIIEEKDLPRKSFKRESKTNKILRGLYESLKPGQIAQFDPKKAGVNPTSLRAQLRVAVKVGWFEPGTMILSRGKEWFFKHG